MSILLAAEPLHVRIDQMVERGAGGPVASAADDGEFLRRVWLDLGGTLPTADEARRFLADRNPAKREKLIDRLLASSDYGRRMQEAWTAMLLERRTEATISDAQWQNYLSASLVANKPWDQLVGELVFTDGSDEESKAAAKFFLVAGRNDPHQKTQDVARLFLGRDMMCAQCHDHPTIDDYSQADYYGLFSFLKDKPAEARSDFESVFEPGKQSTGPRLPGGNEVAIPTFEKGQEAEAAKFVPRRMLARELPTPANLLFTRNSVNRFWFLMMGRGLVHPLDLHHSQNAPSHPELLDLLAADFAANKFDVKQLLREIALSQSYQRSSLLPQGLDEKDASPQQYCVANPKPLSPEQMAWAVMQATGNVDAVLHAPSPEKTSFTYNDYINGRIDQPPENLPDVLALFVGVFGNPPGEPEDTFNPAMGHSLFLMNEKLILDWLKPRAGNLVERLSKLSEPAKIAEELYLSVLTRFPTDEETAEVADYLERYKNRREGAVGELVWALLASTEFRVNH